MKDRNVTYVIPLAAKKHTNYAPIADKEVFKNEQYIVYNVSQYTFG